MCLDLLKEIYIQACRKEILYRKTYDFEFLKKLNVDFKSIEEIDSLDKRKISNRIKSLQKKNISLDSIQKDLEIIISNIELYKGGRNLPIKVKLILYLLLDNAKNDSTKINNLSLFFSEDGVLRSTLLSEFSNKDEISYIELLTWRSSSIKHLDSYKNEWMKHWKKETKRSILKDNIPEEVFKSFLSEFDKNPHKLEFLNKMLDFQRFRNTFNLEEFLNFISQ